LSVVEPEATPLPVASAIPAPAPSAAPAPSSGPVLRADDGEVNHAPAFLQVRPSEPRDEADGEARRPRRRRAPRTFEAGQGVAAPAESDEA
jgi:hypothetical protein